MWKFPTESIEHFFKNNITDRKKISHLRIGFIWGNSKTQFNTKHDKLSKKIPGGKYYFDQIEVWLKDNTSDLCVCDL